MSVALPVSGSQGLSMVVRSSPPKGDLNTPAATFSAFKLQLKSKTTKAKNVLANVLKILAFKRMTFFICIN
jgi:hypothetical protein